MLWLHTAKRPADVFGQEDFHPSAYRISTHGSLPPHIAIHEHGHLRQDIVGEIESGLPQSAIDCQVYRDPTVAAFLLNLFYLQPRK